MSFLISISIEMCNRTRELLMSRIREVLHSLGPSCPVMEEVTRHALFCRDRILSFQGRGDILQAVEKHLSVPNPMKPLVIYGESGVGKTSLMSKIVMETQAKSRERNLAVMYRFCGTTPDSSTGTIVIVYCIGIVCNRGISLPVILKGSKAMLNLFPRAFLID